MKTDKQTQLFKETYTALKQKQADIQNQIDTEYTAFLKDWIPTVIDYKVGDVLEVVDNKRIKFQRMVIYDIAITLFDTTPLVSAYGWWLDKDNNPVKWNGSGFPIYNCRTNYEMKLSDNQINNPVKSI